MSEYYFSANVDNETTLCIAPLTEKRIEMSGQEIEDRSGYFLYQTRHSEGSGSVKIIAQLLSEEAALDLREVLHMD